MYSSDLSTDSKTNQPLQSTRKSSLSSVSLLLGLCLVFVWPQSSEAAIRGVLSAVGTPMVRGVKSGIRQYSIVQSSILPRRFKFSALQDSRSVHIRSNPLIEGEVLSDDLTEIEKGTLRTFTDEAFDAINSFIIYGGGQDETLAIENLDNALAKIKPFESDQPVYFSLSIKPEDFFDVFYKNKKIDSPAFLRTSQRKVVSNNVLVSITKRYSRRSVAEYSAYPAEEEVLFPRGVKFTVTRVEEQGDHLFVEMTQVFPKHDRAVRRLPKYVKSVHLKN